jgi:hypothetical protein
VCEGMKGECVCLLPSDGIRVRCGSGGWWWWGEGGLTEMLVLNPNRLDVI